jgi:sugar fermentation stimulation protein A
MKFINDLLHVKFLKRYKRFFVDVIYQNKKLTVHCPNSGSMLGLLNKNSNAWISESKNPDRKLKFTLEILNDGKSNVGINTILANKIIEEAIINKKVKELKNYKEVKREVKFGDHTRFDFCIDNRVFIEVKNVTLCRKKKIAEFPDAITSRGLKHLEELQKATKNGYKSYLIFLVQREDCNKFKIAEDIDQDYHKEFIKAKKNGVNFLAYSCKVNTKEIFLDNKIKIIF